MHPSHSVGVLTIANGSSILSIAQTGSGHIGHLGDIEIGQVDDLDVDDSPIAHGDEQIRFAQDLGVVRESLCWLLNSSTRVFMWCRPPKSGIMLCNRHPSGASHRIMTSILSPCRNLGRRANQHLEQ